VLSFIVFAGQEIKAGKIVQYEPEPQGSARALILPKHRYPVVVHDNPGTKRWRKTVKEAAQYAIFELPGALDTEEVYSGPVIVGLSFYFTRPKTARREHHTVRPDLDKLCRAVLDGLKEGCVFHDDAQVCGLTATKQYGSPPRCEIEVCAVQGGEGAKTVLCPLPARSDPPSAPRTRDKQRSIPAGASGQLAIEGI